MSISTGYWNQMPLLHTGFDLSLMHSRCFSVILIINMPQILLTDKSQCRIYLSDVHLVFLFFMLLPDISVQKEIWANANEAANQKPTQNNPNHAK